MLPRLDVLTVTYNSERTIAHLVESIPRLSRSFRLRLVIHENSADPEFLARARVLANAQGVEMTGVVCEGNCGFSRACNAMAGESDADWLLFLNPDSRVLAWPDAWNPSAGIWGPQIVDEAGEPNMTFGRRRMVIDEFLMLFARVPPAVPMGSGYVSGAALLIDRPSFKRLGGFDEAYFMYYEDIDLGLRASSLGIAVRMRDDWLVEHLGSHSARETHALSLNRSYESALRFHQRHGHRWRVYVFGYGIYALVRAALELARRAPRARVTAFSDLARRAIADGLTARKTSSRADHPQRMDSGEV